MLSAHAQEHTDSPPVPGGAIASAIILGGGLRSHDLIERLGCPILCLPQDQDRTIIDVWSEAFADVGVRQDDVYLLTDQAGQDRWSATLRSERILVDASEYRGPAGVLRDADDALDSDGPRLVVEHSRLLASPAGLRALAIGHEPGGPTITLATNPDGSFSGALIADREAIQIVPPIGFMDTKEQWIPAAQAAGCTARCIPLNGWSYPIRSLPTYLSALDHLGAFPSTSGARVLGQADRGVLPVAYGGALIARSASIGADVSASRSAICANAEIGGGAVILRSVVGPGARVPKDGVVVDSVVRASDDGNPDRPRETRRR